MTSMGVIIRGAIIRGAIMRGINVLNLIRVIAPHINTPVSANAAMLRGMTSSVAHRVHQASF